MTDTAPDEDLYGPEFEYDGEPVGMFRHGVAPDCAGSYLYEPYRGPGHYNMHQSLKAGGRPRCSFAHEGHRIWFDVVECPEYALLVLDHFERTVQPS